MEFTTFFVAVIPAVVTALGAYAGVKKSADTSLAVYKAETSMELRQLREDFNELSQHVKDHNNLSVRMSVMEQRADGADVRLKNLERGC